MGWWRQMNRHMPHSGDLGAQYVTMSDADYSLGGASITSVVQFDEES